MTGDNMKKAIELIRKTGDKIILFDQENNDGIVLMSLEEYENSIKEKKEDFFNPFKGEESHEENQKIGSLTEDELIDKINQNIAIWKNENQNKQLDEFKVIDLFLNDSVEEILEEETEDNLYYYNEENFFFPESSPSELRQESSDKTEEGFSDLEETVEKTSQKQNSLTDTEDINEDKREEVKKHWNIPVNVKKRAEEVEEEND